jgi:hypothetical protein
MFEETRKMRELCEKFGSRRVLVAGIDISKNKFTIAVMNTNYETKMKARDVTLDTKSLEKLYEEIEKIIDSEGILKLIFGCEPSGIYYKPVLKELMRKYPDAMFKLINPSYRAARDALNGWDPTYGCIYYFNPATATSKWIWSRPIVVKIGKHNFCK